ncbi:hypothetical protein TNCV_4812191 [Trichonephila clavipes]|nr:hypothetical protein TNCV_4812191 [Trichonephila clavipes]
MSRKRLGKSRTIETIENLFSGVMWAQVLVSLKTRRVMRELKFLPLVWQVGKEMGCCNLVVKVSDRGWRVMSSPYAHNLSKSPLQINQLPFNQKLTNSFTRQSVAENCGTCAVGCRSLLWKLVFGGDSPRSQGSKLPISNILLLIYDFFRRSSFAQIHKELRIYSQAVAD